MTVSMTFSFYFKRNATQRNKSPPKRMTHVWAKKHTKKKLEQEQEQYELMVSEKINRDSKIVPAAQSL